jgi:hypothetical protein
MVSPRASSRPVAVRDSPRMPPEILSTSRPSPLRLWGFVCVALGALLAGLGAVRDWAVVGFPGDVTGQLDVPIKGTDVWEGKVVLAAAALALIVLIAIRLARSPRARRTGALAIFTLGALALALALSVAIRPTTRFGGAHGLDELAANLSQQLDQPEAAIRAQLAQRFGNHLRVDLGPGIWLVTAGGILTALGGALSQAWVRRAAGGYEASEESRMSEAPPGGPADPGAPADPADPGAPPV